jgi:hypothetical protein
MNDFEPVMKKERGLPARGSCSSWVPAYAAKMAALLFGIDTQI